MTNLPPTTEDLLSKLNQSLPYSEDAERAVIGCLLNHPRFCEEAPAPGQFYHVHYRAVAAVIMALNAAGEPVDFITVTRKLRESGQLDEVGGAYQLSVLAGEAAIPAHFAHYCG